MFTKPMEGGPDAATLPSTKPTHEDPLAVVLREHVYRLRLIQNIISVSVMALRHQNAELDDDVATVLDQHASNELEFEVTVLEATLATLVSQRPAKRVAA